MKIQYTSDLHLEFPENRAYFREHPLPAAGDVLILAGDIICDKYKKKARAFYQDVESKFELVVSTMGNHEFYHGRYEYAYPSYSRRIAPNHIKLNNRTHVHRDVKFIVSTLWSHVPDEAAEIVAARLNDYRLIEKGMRGDGDRLTVQDSNRLFEISRKFLERELALAHDGPVIVVTHHLPSLQCIVPQWRGSALASAFASDLDDLIKSHRIDVWIFGHQHDFFEGEIAGTRMLSNPLGYVGTDSGDFRPDTYFEVEGGAV